MFGNQEITVAEFLKWMRETLICGTPINSPTEMSSDLTIYQEQVWSGIVHGHLRHGHSPEVILTLLCCNASCLQPHIVSSS